MNTSVSKTGLAQPVAAQTAHAALTRCGRLRHGRHHLLLGLLRRLRQRPSRRGQARYLSAPVMVQTESYRTDPDPENRLADA